MSDDTALVRRFTDVDRNDAPHVGGKNASLGEMLQEPESEQVGMPGGLATTAAACREFFEHNDLPDRLRDELSRLKDDSDALTDVGQAGRSLIRNGRMPLKLDRASAIVTDHGGTTTHAAIVSRELVIPATVGKGEATSAVEDGEDVTVSICQQAPSDHPEFAEFLVEAGIDSISVDPDSVIEMWKHVAEAEKRR